MIKIGKLFRSPTGSQEVFQLEFLGKNLNVPEVPGRVQVKGHLIRVPEGIALILDDLNTSQVGFCSHCGKKLKQALKVQNSEWLFYDSHSKSGKDEEDQLQINMHDFEIDPAEPVRQELILNLDSHLHCKKNCKPQEEISGFSSTSSQENKPFAHLKDLL